MRTARLSEVPRTVGEHVKAWRMRRRYSQLECALDVEMSQRHLSFIESNRAKPSRDMILRIAEHLDVPLRERNAMLLAAGYAPHFQHRSLDDPSLAPARRAIDQILNAHEPFPALAVDRHWHLVSANAAISSLLALVSDQDLLQPPVNVLRLSLHPKGLAPHIVNLGEWQRHIVERLRRQIEISADAGLMHLLAEIQQFPGGDDDASGISESNAVMIPFRLSLPGGTLNFFSTTTVFGTPLDITLSEIALECFYPADAQTADALRRMADES